MGWFDFTFSRRCIAVDLGQSRIKAILAERKGNRIEVLHAFNLDLQEEGLLTLEETNRHISRILLEMGEYPVSLVIPQHVAISHLIALPSEGRGGSWERMIEQETQKLTGLSESAIVYDYFRLRPFQRNRNPVWVTVSRERELEDQINRLHGSGLAVSEVTNTGNALASAYLATQPPLKRVVLADIGATATTVVVVEHMQPVYATAFPFGGELFTEAIAAARQIPFDEAETIKKTEIIFAERDQYPEFIGAVERWHQELQKVLGECMKLPEDEDEPVKVMLSGGSSLQPGFLEFLQDRCPLDYHLWRDSTRGVDSQTYAVAYGAALAGLNIAPVRSSLLPKPLRQARFRMVQVALLNTLAALFLIALLVVLVADASIKRDGLDAKTEALRGLEEAHEKTAVVEDLLAKRTEEYNKIVPIVQQQKKTRDLLRTIAYMQEVRAKENIWFVLLADGKSYLEKSTVSGSREQPHSRAEEGAAGTTPGNRSLQWDRFVAELAVSTPDDETLPTLRRVVDTLSSKTLYRNVDTLAPSEQKQLVEEAVTLPGRTFSLNLELVPSDLRLPEDEQEEGLLFNP